MMTLFSELHSALGERSSSVHTRAETNTPSDEYDSYHEYRVANTNMYLRIHFFSEAINFIRQYSKFHTVIMLSNFINSIKTIIEMNELYNFLSTSALKIYFLNINTYQGVFHPFNIVLHKLKIFIRQPHCGVRHHHDTADITITSQQ